MRHKIFFLIGLFCLLPLQAQEPVVSNQIRAIYDTALQDGRAYPWLEHLSQQIGSRLSGSLGAERAVSWGEEELKSLGLDRVFLQPVMVPKWVRGNFEYANIETSPGNTINVPVCALGGSIATPSAGIRAQVVEVQLINTFQAYSRAVDQRSRGAEEAARYGAVGVIVRSMNLKLDDYPHTGAMRYGDLPLKDRIPAAAISTNGAELLSSMLKLNPSLRFFLKQNCKNYPDVLSYNVVGEIKGSVTPENIMVVGGHLDSWDLGDGAHDDGAGIVQSMEVARIFKTLNYRPKNTLRVVLFMNE